MSTSCAGVRISTVDALPTDYWCVRFRSFVFDQVIAWLSVATLLLDPALARSSDSELLLAPQTPVSEVREATLDLDSLRKHVSANLAALQSIKATIRSWGVKTADQPDIAIVAAKNEFRYEFQWHGGFQGPDDDPESSMRFYGAGFWNVFRPFERNYEVTKRFAIRPYSEKILRQFFFESLGWWPPGDASPALKRQGEPKFINEILADPRCQVQKWQEQVDGHWCHVAEIPGVERLWAATETGVVRRRQLYILDGPAKGKTLAILHLRDFEQVAPGLLLPRSIEREFVDAGKVTYHHVDAIEVNGVEDSQFAFSPPPGTLIYDRDSDSFQQIPGGLDALDRIANRIVAITSATKSQRYVSWDIIRNAVAFAAGGAIYALLCIVPRFGVGQRKV